MFTNYLQYAEPKPITQASGDPIFAIGEGKVNVEVFNGEGWTQAVLHDVFLAPALQYNLFSVRYTVRTQGFRYCEQGQHMIMMKDDKVAIIGRDYDGLMLAAIRFPNFSANVMHDAELWHQRLAHVNYKTIELMRKQGLLAGQKQIMPFCESCALGKSHKQSYPYIGSRQAEVGQLSHIDLCETKCLSIKGQKYMLLCKDDHSGYDIGFFTVDKRAETILTCIKVLVNHVKLYFKTDLLCLRSDNGGEFVNALMKEYLFSRGIRHQTIEPQCPQSAGYIERENRSVMELARTMIIDSRLPLTLWAEAAATAIYIRNRTPKRRLDQKSPYQVVFKKRPNLSFIRV